MNQVKVTLELITSMFSAGANGKVEAEFRITELKALLRSTFREFFYYESLDDLKEKEEILFGSTNRKSPVAIKLGGNIKIRFQNEENSVLHKYCPAQAIPSGTKINIIFQSVKEEFLEIYLYILKLASITGALGKRSRKGMGVFKIIDIDDNEITDNSFEKLLSGYEEKFKIGGKNYTIKTRKFSIEKQEQDNIKYAIECDNMPDIHYAKTIHKIYLGNSLDEKSKEKIEDVLFKVSNLTHERLDSGSKFFSQETLKKINDKKVVKDVEFNKEILGNYRGGVLSRFACPVYVTIYQKSQYNLIENYLIIKELNYNYIYKKDSNSKLKEMNPIDELYAEEFINKIKIDCVVK